MLPLDIFWPYPEAIDIVPPVLAAEWPAYMFISPPLPVVVPSVPPDSMLMVPPSSFPFVRPALTVISPPLSSVPVVPTVT